MQLGLCNPPEPIYLYVRATEDKGVACWYQYNIDNQQQIPVKERAIAGYLKELRLTNKEYKGKENIKLDIVIAADEIYVIRTGVETNFAKSFLLAIAQVPDLSRPLIFSCQSGQENVVFCRIYDENKARVKSEWYEANWAEIIDTVQQKLTGEASKRGILMKEIDTIIQSKRLSTSDCQAYAMQWTGKKSRSQMSEQELLLFRDRLSRVLP